MSNLKPRWRRDKASKRERWNLWWRGEVIATVFAMNNRNEFRYTAGDKYPAIRERFSLTDAKEEAMFRADW